MLGAMGRKLPAKIRSGKELRAFQNLDLRMGVQAQTGRAARESFH